MGLIRERPESPLCICFDADFMRPGTINKTNRIVSGYGDFHSKCDSVHRQHVEFFGSRGDREPVISVRRFQERCWQVWNDWLVHSSESINNSAPCLTYLAAMVAKVWQPMQLELEHGKTLHTSR